MPEKVTVNCPEQITIGLPGERALLLAKENVGVVEVGIQGPPGGPGLQGVKGDKGDKGDPGSGGDLSYTHIQNAASTTWPVSHNLGKRPTIACVDSGGTEFDAEVHYVDDNNLVVLLAYSISGKVYCN